MELFITTLGRVKNQKTLKNLSPNLRKNTTLVVQKHEALLYMDKYGEQQRILVLPESIKTLGPTRRFMHQHAMSLGLPYYVLLDDDLDFYIRRDPNNWQLKAPTDAEMDMMFDEIEDRLKEGFVHVGVSGREGNNRIEKYEAICGRYMRLLAYRTDMPSDVEIGRIDGMSDFDLNLQLLRRGFASTVFYRYAQGQSGTQTPGGCALNRTLETHSKEVDFMVKTHTPHVRKRMKNNKGGGEFGVRPEVTIMWLNAYEEGRRKY